MLCTLAEHSLTKVMVSHELLRLTVNNQIAFDQRVSTSIPKPDGLLLPELVSKLETLDTITFT